MYLIGSETAIVLLINRNFHGIALPYINGFWFKQ
jgi:hypothetical protein